MIIGLSGHADVGKTAAARAMSLEMGFRVVSIAEPLRDALHMLNPFVGRSGITLGQLLDEHGWERTVHHPLYGVEVRRLMIMQSRWMAMTFGQDVLVNLAHDQLIRSASPDGVSIPDTASIVISDVRLVHEARWVKDLGGAIIGIQRTGAVPASSDPTERSLPDHMIDQVVVNDGDRDQFTDRLLEVVADLTNPVPTS